MKSMVVVDGQGYCLFANSGAKGSVHDGTFLRLSSMGRTMDQFYSPDEYVLADGIYHSSRAPGNSHVLSPFNIRTVRRCQQRATAATSAEEREAARQRLALMLQYNDAQRRSRVVVENFFARLVGTSHTVPGVHRCAVLMPVRLLHLCCLPSYRPRPPAPPPQVCHQPMPPAELTCCAATKLEDHQCRAALAVHFAAVRDDLLRLCSANKPPHANWSSAAVPPS